MVEEDTSEGNGEVRTFNWDTDSSVYLQVGKELGQRKGWKQSKAGDVRADVWLCDGRKKNAVPYALLGEDAARRQLVNYYRGSGCITLKSMMVRTLSSHINDSGGDPSTVFPVTYILYPRKPPSEHQSQGLSAIAAAREAAKRKKLEAEDERDALLRHHQDASANGTQVAWILKSSAGGKGEGISISRDVGELVSIVDASEKESAWVVSRYIERPMLLSGRKFDLRCWVLLDCDYGVYMFEEGVLRTSSFQYDDKDLTNRLQHLTNHCVQATASEFGSHEEGNEVSFAQMQTYMLNECGGKTFYADILPQLKSICCLSLEAGRGKMQVSDGSNLRQFQLFGFDFMIDDEYKVWLIEINGNPASRESLLFDMARGIVDTAIVSQFQEEQRVDGAGKESSHEGVPSFVRISP